MIVNKHVLILYQECFWAFCAFHEKCMKKKDMYFCTVVLFLHGLLHPLDAFSLAHSE